MHYTGYISSGLRQAGARGNGPQSDLVVGHHQTEGPIPYLYYSLYVILDLFSRYVVGWMVAPHENARLAQRLIEATCHKQGIGPHQITMHADRDVSLQIIQRLPASVRCCLTGHAL